MLRILAVSLVGLAVAGCSNCSRDPSQVGLGCATANLASGVYEEDDAKIRREIAALDSRREQLQAEADRLSAEAARLSGQRRDAARRLAALNEETAGMNARLADLTKREKVDRARLAELRDREAALSRQVLAADDGGATQAEVAKLEAERAQLSAQIDQLLAVS